MKKVIINLGASILLTVTIILSIISLTLFNSRFMIKVVEHYQVSTSVITNFENRTNQSGVCVTIEKDKVKKDLEKYIKSGYQEPNFKVNSNKAINKIYNEEINLFKIDFSYKKIRYVVDIVTIIFVIITGNVFLKSKKYHNIYSIFIITSILLIAVFGYNVIYMDGYFEILNKALNIINHIILASAIVLLEVSLWNKIKSRFIKS